MLKGLFKFEEGLLRVETWLLVICVLLMLVLAGYTVFYRNVLIPWQNHLTTGGPPVSQTEDELNDGRAEADDDDDNGDNADDGDADGFGGGFGGGFGEKDEADDGDADGFGGGFGAVSAKKMRPM
ncbi:MAG: hypothetical protein ACLFVJ_04220, partial [Persicimonas sp.]